jgi:flagellar biosynthesis protein FlhB
MAENPSAEKTEQPTQRRLEKAQEKGQVAQSEELPAAVAIIVLTGVLTISGPGLLGWLMAQIEQSMTPNAAIFHDRQSFVHFFNAKIGDSTFAVMPLLGVLLVGGILSCIAVGGLNFAPQALMPKLSELDPVKGFEKLFNVRALMKLGLSIAKFTVISVIIWHYFQDKTDDLTALRWAESMQMIIMISRLIVGMLIRVCVALLILAAAEVLFQKYKHNQELMMTKQEVKQERKDMEGSPELKGRIRRIQIEMSHNRMLQEIPKADVVIVNPTHVAVVLKYDIQSMNAPMLVAKGADHLAEKIREIARAYGVPIVRKPELARTIFSTVKEGQMIPSGLYTAVAEVMAMIYRLRRNRG